MKKKLTHFIALATIALLMVMVLFARQASAGWIIRDGTAVNPIQVCRDGIYMGVGSQSGPGPVNVTAVLQSGGQELFNENYTLPDNPVPEAFLTHSDFFTEFWAGAFQPLAVGTKIYLEGGIEVPMVTVADCYLNPAVPQAGPGFTYQGYLNDSNSPANGSYDFTFSLHNAANGGAQIGSPIIVDNLAVTDGLFMTGLNFGTDAFNGEARWLQISVRPGNSGGAYTALNPRQSLAPAPYALHAVNIPEHDHFGETWIGNHNPLELTGSFNNAPLVINNVITNPNSGNTTGDGIAMDEIGGTGVSMFSVGFTGVSVWSTGGDGMMVREASDDGFNICATGSNTCFTEFDPGSHGLEVGNAQDDGVHIVSADSNGLRVQNAGDDGVHINSADSNGLQIEDAGSHAIQIDDATFDAIRIADAGDDGVQVGNFTNYPNYGLYIPSPGVPYTALLIQTENTNGEWALSTNDKIRASNVTLRSASILAVVDGTESLATGDLVAASGLAENLPDGLSNIPRVRIADGQTWNGVIGVVESKMVAQPLPGKEDSGEMEVYSVSGQANPGDYVSLTVLGVTYVKADATGGNIEPGQRLTVADQPGQARAIRYETLNGMTVAEGAPLIGVALGQPDSERGLVPVFFTLR